MPSSPSSPSITGFDSDNESATGDDVADKAHGHRWLKGESHFPSSLNMNVADKPRGQRQLKAQRHLRSLPSANVADMPRGYRRLKVKRYAQSHFLSSPPLGTLSTLPPPFFACQVDDNAHGQRRRKCSKNTECHGTPTHDRNKKRAGGRSQKPDKIPIFQIHSKDEEVYHSHGSFSLDVYRKKRISMMKLFEVDSVDYGI